jgi:O-antigen/teichoic acid export membrane protein
MQSMTSVVARNSLAQIGARLITGAASLLVLPFLARYLGPDLFGEYSLVLALYLLLLTVTDLGIVTIAVREAARPGADVNATAVQAFLLRAVAATALTGLVLVGFWATPYPSRVKVDFGLVSVGVLLAAAQAGYTVVLQTTLRLYVLSLADVAGRLASTGMVLAIVRFAGTVEYSRETGLYLVFASMSAGALFSLAVLLVLTRSGAGIGLHTDWRRGVAMLRDALPLGLVMLTGLLHSRLDTVLLFILTSSHDVGIYNLAYRILDVMLPLQSLVMASVYPLMSAHIADPARLMRISQRALELLATGALPIVIGLMIAAPQIVTFLGGRAYVGSILTLRILAPAILFSYLNVVFAYLLVLRNRQLLVLAANAGAALINLALNLILIPRFSYLGAAVVTVITEAIILVAVFGFSRRLYGFGWSGLTLAKILLAGAVMAAAVLLIRDANLALLVPVAGVVYTAALLLLRVADKATLVSVFGSLGGVRKF